MDIEYRQCEIFLLFFNCQPTLIQIELYIYQDIISICHCTIVRCFMPYTWFRFVEPQRESEKNCESKLYDVHY